jgi:hypothetical protein
LLICIKNLAHEKYLSQYYFGLIDKKNYNFGEKNNKENENKDILSVEKFKNLKKYKKNKKFIFFYSYFS